MRHTESQRKFCFDVSDTALESSIFICKKPEISQLNEISNLYTEWLIEDPCSHCACYGGVQYARDTAWLKENTFASGSRTIIAKSNGKIAGFAQFFVESSSFPEFAGGLANRFEHLGKIAYIYLILVRQENYRQGLGKKIYLEVFKECSLNDCDAVIAEIFVCPVPNSSSLRFHEAMGFEYSGQSTTHLRRIGERHIELSYTQMFKCLKSMS